MNVRALVNQYKKKNDAVQQIKRTKQVKMIGSSMLPILDPNEISILFVTECPEYEVGNIVVFEYENSVPGFSVHRIIRLEGDKVLTKGDNNLQSDDMVDRNAIIGKIEKALYTNGSFHNVKTSKIIAWLSRCESDVEKVFSKKIVVLLHCMLIKIYVLFK